MTSARQHLSRPVSVGVADRGVRRCVASLRPRGARDHVCVGCAVYTTTSCDYLKARLSKEEITHMQQCFGYTTKNTTEKHVRARRAAGERSRDTLERSLVAQHALAHGKLLRLVRWALSGQESEAKPFEKPQRQPFTALPVVACARTRAPAEDKQSMHARSALTAATRLPCGAGGRWETRAVCCVARVHT